MTYHRPADIAVVASDEALYLATLPAGPIHVLEGTAALIWEHALERTAADTVASVAAAVCLEPADVDADTRQFLRELVAGKLLATQERSR